MTNNENVKEADEQEGLWFLIKAAICWCLKLPFVTVSFFLIEVPLSLLAIGAGKAVSQLKRPSAPRVQKLD